jgi:hypothetical protein
MPFSRPTPAHRKNTERPDRVLRVAGDIARLVYYVWEVVKNVWP